MEAVGNSSDLSPSAFQSNTSEEINLNVNLGMKKSLLNKLKEAFSSTKISVEPVLLLHNIASNMAWVTSQDLMEQKACRVNLGYSSYVCDNLNEFDEQQIAVQSMVSSFLMWRSILEASIKESLASASDCCGLDKLSDAFYSTVKPRPSQARRYIIILVLAMLLDSFVIWGESNVKYLFTQRALDWNYDQYSHYGTASTLLSVIGALVVVPLLTMASLRDTLIGLLGALSRTFERVIYIFANSPERSWLMYLGAAVGTGSPLAPIAIRSQISKLALDDVGQIYSVMAVGESLLPFVSAPTYKNIYAATVDGFVGAFYVLSACINSLMATCFVYLYISMRKQKLNIRLPFT